MRALTKWSLQTPLAKTSQFGESEVSRSGERLEMLKKRRKIFINKPKPNLSLASVSLDTWIFNGFQFPFEHQTGNEKQRHKC